VVGLLGSQLLRVGGAVTGLGFVNLFAGLADLALLLAVRERHDLP
jgi:hypothetical protein